MDNNYQPDHFQKCAEILTKLKPLVTAQGRKDAMKELGLSDTTITAYLKGKVKNLDTAVQLIKFFRAAVELRDSIINEHPIKGNRKDLVL